MQKKKFNSLMDLNKEGQVNEMNQRTQSYEELLSAEEDNSDAGEAGYQMMEAPLQLRLGKSDNCTCEPATSIKGFAGGLQFSLIKKSKFIQKTQDINKLLNKEAHELLKKQVGGHA